MSSSPVSTFSQIWLRWKALKLPWRKRWLAGTDLAGNTFWYFKNSLSPRPRRILQSNPRVAYSDVEISPQWHQWLRYTRPLPPTILEQQADFVRQRELKYLVQAADERWAAKPSVLDKPRMETLQAGGGTKANGKRAGGADRVEEKEIEESETQKNSPWSVKQGNPGEGWQPEAWAPVTKK